MLANFFERSSFPYVGHDQEGEGKLQGTRDFSTLVSTLLLSPGSAMFVISLTLILF
jgi:hypothetical protein